MQARKNPAQLRLSPPPPRPELRGVGAGCGVFTCCRSADEPKRSWANFFLSDLRHLS